ncbi:polysaccharide biosynthesis protein [Desertimonas flava]|uniref:polysaccharide biosynthesis protein n=1 Tax=Desertimonas flava TaxID=2064846 RepID=UPI000E3519FB|nr:polysaccharide biosynthesis protein [Desertimonas flava]
MRCDELGRHRDASPIDTGWLNGKRILVTGAGGSIGGELCVQIAERTGRLPFMLDRDDEHLCRTLYRLDPACNLVRPELVLSDIRDPGRLDQLFAAIRPDVVFHAAAMKDVVLGEAHPIEAIKTNVHGTINVVEASRRVGVDTFVNISTDKAADPIGVMGRTKRLTERIVAAAALGQQGRWLSTRFGNVLGSGGSITEVFRRQIAHGGPVTVTHPDVDRYFMTLSEAVALVLTAGGIGRSGDTCILDMGDPVKIHDVATLLIAEAGGGIDIAITGLRPGERLSELLVGPNETAEPGPNPSITHVRVPAVSQAGRAREIQRILAGATSAAYASNS